MEDRSEQKVKMYKMVSKGYNDTERNRAIKDRDVASGEKRS